MLANLAFVAFGSAELQSWDSYGTEKSEWELNNIKMIQEKIKNVANSEEQRPFFSEPPKSQ